MALSATVTMPGGITLPPVYFLVTSARCDKLTGEIVATLLGFASKDRRNDYEAGHAAKLSALNEVSKIEGRIAACVPIEDATRDDVNAIEAQKAGLEADLAAAQVRVTQAQAIIDANGPAFPQVVKLSERNAAAITNQDGSVSIAGLYEWLKRQPQFLAATDA